MTVETIQVGSLTSIHVSQYQDIVDGVDIVNESFEHFKNIEDMLRLGLNEATRHIVQVGLEELASNVTLPEDTDQTDALIEEIRTEHQNLVTDAYHKLNEKLETVSTLLVSDINPLVTEMQMAKEKYQGSDADTFVFNNIGPSSALTVDGLLCAFEEDSWDSLVSLVRFLSDLHEFTPKAIGGMIVALKAPTDAFFERLNTLLSDTPVLDGRLSESFCDDLKTKIPAIERTDIMSGLEVTQFQLEDWKEGTPEDIIKLFPYTHCIKLNDQPTQSATTSVEITKPDLLESIDHATSIAKAIVTILSTEGPKFTTSILNDNPELFIGKQVANLYYKPIISASIRLLQILQEYSALVSSLATQDLKTTLESFEF